MEMMILKDTLIKSILWICLANVEKLPAAACFRAVANDARFATEQVTFSANLNKQVQGELLNQFNIIRINKFKVCNNAFIFVQDFTLLKQHQEIIGNPCYLTENDYNNIRKKKPNPRRASF